MDVESVATCVYVHINVDVYIYTYKFMCIYIYKHTCKEIYKYIYANVCINVCIQFRHYPDPMLTMFVLSTPMISCVLIEFIVHCDGQICSAHWISATTNMMVQYFIRGGQSDHDHIETHGGNLNKNIAKLVT